MTGRITSPISLSQALRLDNTTRMALVGAGGKTTALFEAGRQLSQQLDAAVLLSASTHLALHQLDLADAHFVLNTPQDIPTEKDMSAGLNLFTGPQAADARVSGLALSLLDGLNTLAGALNLPLLVEADGSRRLPLKAPAEHEPVIPAFANMVAVVAGMSGLGCALDGECVHRPERFAALAGIDLGEKITVDALEKVLLSPQGGLKGIPQGASRIAILNQADTSDLQNQARQLAARLLPVYQTVLISSLVPPQGNSGGPGAQGLVFWVQETVAGVILAAGGAHRFGGPKQLANWQGQPMIRRAALAALHGGLSPVVVVTGAYAPEIQAALTGLPLQIVYNPNWEQGQSTSLQAGLRALPEGIGAAMFLLSDQPALTPQLVQAVLNKRFESFAAIVAPRVGDRRANPVLFDRRTFPRLMALQGDVGGRVLFSKDSPYTPVWVDWSDPDILVDLDSPKDYDRLKDLNDNKSR